jgi:hypothetical protein
MVPLPPTNKDPFLITYFLLATTWVLSLYTLFLYSDTPTPCRCSLRLAQAVCEPNIFPYKYLNNLIQVILSAYTAYEDGRDSVPKRRHIKFRGREITQKKEHNICITGSVAACRRTCMTCT